MAITVGKYQFHSWSRRGIATSIKDVDDLGTGASAQVERAQVDVDVLLNGAGLSKSFKLIGPGDIIGINRDMIVRTEPLNWITNFEPNYLAFVEFYDEDFTWRYTPAGPDGKKLRPWLMLLVLAEGEFQRTKLSVPLPAIKITSKDVFPPVTETWLWAHMHSNADLDTSSFDDYEKFLLSLNQTVNADPDQLYSRLFCPRKLKPNTAYNVFLVPSFETGRLAGLQQDPTGKPAQLPSWDANGAKGDMPVYFEWYFLTGENEDFESLVKLLEPRTMDPKLGIRDMDCSQPGFVRADDANRQIPGTAPAVLGLEGALEAPTTQPTVFPDTSVPNNFGIELQKIANLPYTTLASDSSSDPVVSVPIYGGNHAKKSITDVVQLDIQKDNWVNDLNRDPRTRVAAGFGTTVIQQSQSYFMKKAWAQVAGILQANKIIRATVFMMKVAMVTKQKTFDTFANTMKIAVARPVLSKILGSPTTIREQLSQSPVPNAVFSGPFRRLTSPGRKIMKRMTNGRSFDHDTFIQQINNGQITAASKDPLPTGLPTADAIAAQIAQTSSSQPAWLQWLVAHRLIAMLILLALAILLAVVTGVWLLIVAGAVVAVGGYIYLQNLSRQAQQDQSAASNLTNPQLELNSLAQIPPQPSFSLKLSSESVAPPATPAAPGADSVEAAHFRQALAGIDTRLAIHIEPVVRKPLDLNNAIAKVSAAIDPAISFPARMKARIRFPLYIVNDKPEKIFPAMAYPDFDDAMYSYLNAISQELLLPNIKLIPPNTISLVKTNPKFIESYMVGLNHEMGRELLWNEYPTDERGSYFRQFWDVKGMIEPSQVANPADAAEKLKDITRLDTWPTASALGTHPNRPVPASQAVLLIRGELLKRYPNTLIFAQKAIAGSTPDGPDVDQNLTDENWLTELKFPLYHADAQPDIKFFGFDLTLKQALGTDLTPPFTDHLGWFFVIQEVPGEPRFGMDPHFEPDNNESNSLTWDDLSWENFPADMEFITAGVPPNMYFPGPWATNAAQMGNILFRRPSIVAVHASEMLENLTL